MEIREMTALTLGCAIKSRQVGVREAVKACLDEIEKRTVRSTLFWRQMRRKYMTG